MYPPNDPRAKLASGDTSKPPPPTGFGKATYARFYEQAPQEEGPNVRSWLARGQNFLVRYSETQPGAALARRDQPDEYAVLLPDPAVRIAIEWGGTRTEVAGSSVAFVPAGASTIHVSAGGPVYSIFTTRSVDLAALCSNADGYQPDPNVPPLADWPAPPGGWKVRSYPLDVPAQEGRFGRIFRCTTIMVNALDVRNGPRDPKNLSPHDHDDFQQGSLAVGGEFVHHLRWPWTSDATLWREDEHVRCASPSVTFIPARVLHTSQAMGAGRNVLYDLFSPPRMDFSLKPGWVLNAADYPDLPA